MSFVKSNIDRAIVLTLFDLNGFQWPTGFRAPRSKDYKGFSFIPANLVAFSDGYFSTGERQASDPSHPNLFKSRFADYLETCRRLARACDKAQREAVRNIIKEILERHEKRSRLPVDSIDPSSRAYIFPLRKGNYWGKALIALATAFRVAWDRRGRETRRRE